MRRFFYYDFSGPNKILGTAILGGSIDNINNTP